MAFGVPQRTYPVHTFRPGFYLGFTSDFYPLKTKQNIFLISLNLGYQQYSQAISWSGNLDSSNNYANYKYYESKVNRELYYSLLTGFNIKGFVFKAGITFRQMLANSGSVSYTIGNSVLLNSENNRWPSSAYKLSFGSQGMFGCPLYVAYNIRLNGKIYITPEGSVDIGFGKVDLIDFGGFGNTWGRMITASVGISIHFSTLKEKK